MDHHWLTGRTVLRAQQSALPTKGLHQQFEGQLWLHQLHGVSCNRPTCSVRDSSTGSSLRNFRHFDHWTVTVAQVFYKFQRFTVYTDMTSSVSDITPSLLLSLAPLFLFAHTFFIRFICQQMGNTRKGVATATCSSELLNFDRATCTVGVNISSEDQITRGVSTSAAQSTPYIYHVLA